MKPLFKKQKGQNPAKVELVVYKHLPRLKFFTLLIGLFLLAIFIWTVLFSLKQVNRALGRSEEFFFLQSELGVEPIDFTKLQQVTAQWEAKLNEKTTPITRDPFHKIKIPEMVDEAPIKE